MHGDTCGQPGGASAFELCEALQPCALKARKLRNPGTLGSLGARYNPPCSNRNERRQDVAEPLLDAGRPAVSKAVSGHAICTPWINLKAHLACRREVMRG